MSLENEFLNINDEFDYYYYKDNFIYEETIFDVWNNCVKLSTFSVISLTLNLVLLNFGFGCLLSIGFLSKNWFHILFGLIGMYLISTLNSVPGKIILIACFAVSYLILLLSSFIKKSLNISNTNFIKLISISLLVLSEHYLLDKETWLEIRGVVMVLVMKLVSLADDLEKSNFYPNIIEYFGYVLCGANVLFGPWISYNDYINLYKNSKKKNIWWIISILKIVITSIIFLTISNCWTSYLISENSNRWFIAYREAFSFRTSHYFICYLAESGMVASGFTSSKNEWKYTITDPMKIEFPSALAVVVKNWNKPMHDFLKKYVFQSFLKYGKFSAILTTFLISSFLHGFELRVSVVLITIGLFSYIQVIRRDKLAEMFNCCIKVRSCKNCNHKYKMNSIQVKCLIIICSIFTILHLIYLGIVMDPSTETIGIFMKWKNLYFISHIIMFIHILLMFY